MRMRVLVVLCVAALAMTGGFGTPSASGQAVIEYCSLFPFLCGDSPPSIGTSIFDKLTQTVSFIESGDIADACSTLKVIVNELKAQSGKKISSADAAAAISLIQQLEAELGC